MTDMEVLRRKELATPYEISRALSLSMSTVRRMIKSGEFEAVKVGDSVRVKTKSVIGLLDGKKGKED